MSPRERVRGRTIPALIGCFYAGIAVGWILHATFTPESASTNPAEVLRQAQPAQTDAQPVARERRITEPVATSGLVDAVAELRRRHLRVPVDDVDVEKLKGGFGERRDAGGRGHEAVDILAPRNSAVHAVENGTIAKLFQSKAGGITIYQFDPDKRFNYYYAHLERYADGLHEGQAIARGDVIGFVGTSGNAPANTPHLHFAIFQVGEEGRWWEGTPLDPYEVFRP